MRFRKLRRVLQSAEDVGVGARAHAGCDQRAGLPASWSLRCFGHGAAPALSLHFACVICQHAKCSMPTCLHTQAARSCRFSTKAGRGGQLVLPLLCCVFGPTRFQLCSFCRVGVRCSRGSGTRSTRTDRPVASADLRGDCLGRFSLDAEFAAC